MISESAEGVSSAALRPWTARAAMSWLLLSANPLTSEASGEQAQPGQEDAAAGEQVGDAAAQEQAAAGHHQVGGDQPGQLAALRGAARWPMEGRAVLTTEMSSTTRIWAARATASSAQDFLEPAARRAAASAGRAWWAGWCVTSELLGLGVGLVASGGAGGGCVLICCSSGVPVRTAETTSVDGAGRRGRGRLVLEQSGVGGGHRAVDPVGRERRQLVLGRRPAGAVEGLRGGEHGERAVAAAW